MRLSPDPCHIDGHSQDGNYHSLWAVGVPPHALWSVGVPPHALWSEECSSGIPEVDGWHPP